MRRMLRVALLGASVAITTAPARAQTFSGAYFGAPGPYSSNPGGIYTAATTPHGGIDVGAAYYAAPGYYGMGYGVPSFGVPRTYSSYSSSYGPGYGYGYPPSSFLPGRYGVGLWRPGIVTPGYVYGASYYRTFPVPYRPLVSYYGPAVGYYAPGFGPPAFTAW